MEHNIRQWNLVAPGKLELATRTLTTIKPGHVLVKTAGCGICHTDIGYLYGDVPPRKKLPLVLGHEASGVVVDAAPEARQWIGRRVLVPAVWTCGECAACKRGRPTACSKSLMPGNDVDGAFATHFEAPAAMLCAVDAAPVALDAPIGKAGLQLWEIAVVADAVTTPVQAVRRCGLGVGELAVVVGVGGVGSFVVQLARALGATVAAIDVDPVRLELARTLGAALVIDAREETKKVKGALRQLAEQHGLGHGSSADGWRVFEVSGTKPGQELAWSLLSRGGSISIVGYTPEPSQVRLSNLMAFDATAYGNWGCDPALYPEALELVSSGSVAVRQLIRKESFEDAPAICDAVHARKIRERVVLVP